MRLRGKMGKKNKKSEKINNELDSFIKRHRSTIISNAREFLGDRSTEVSNEKIITMFKAKFRERMDDAQIKRDKAFAKGDVKSKNVSVPEAKQIMKDTFHTYEFYGEKNIQYEALRESMKGDAWEEFRTLNRHHKIDADKFGVEKKKPQGIRTRHTYTTDFGQVIYMDLIYHDDGSYSWSVHYA